MTLKITVALFYIIFGVSLVGLSQEKVVKDSSNYYDFFKSNNSGLHGKELRTMWLSQDDVIPIIIDEMKIAGFDLLFEYSLYKLRSGQDIVLSAYCRKSNFGIIYLDQHNMVPDRKQRKIGNFYKDILNIDYSEYEENYLGEPAIIKIKKLPSNIIVLSADCYWYQITENTDDNNVLITKDLIINILRMDIRSRIKKYLKIDK